MTLFIAVDSLKKRTKATVLLTCRESDSGSLMTMVHLERRNLSIKQNTNQKILNKQKRLKLTWKSFWGGITSRIALEQLFLLYTPAFCWEKVCTNTAEIVSLLLHHGHHIKIQLPHLFYSMQNPDHHRAHSNNASRQNNLWWTFILKGDGEILLNYWERQSDQTLFS